jgi:hypothetical protein
MYSGVLHKTADAVPHVVRAIGSAIIPATIYRNPAWWNICLAVVGIQYVSLGVTQ